MSRIGFKGKLSFPHALHASNSDKLAPVGTDVVEFCDIFAIFRSTAANHNKSAPGLESFDGVLVHSAACYSDFPRQSNIVSAHEITPHSAMLIPETRKPNGNTTED